MKPLSAQRVGVMLFKEWREGRWQAAAWLPLTVSMAAAILPVVAVGAWPWLDGAPLELTDLPWGEGLMAAWPSLARLDSRAAAQAIVFSQFLFLLVLAPVTAATATVAQSMVAERTSRALEPLLASPLTSAELVVSKVVAALVPSLLIEAAGLVLYVLVIAAAAEPGVLTALATWRSVAIVAAVGPTMTLAALQVTLLAATRTLDARTAQHIGSQMAVVCSVLLVAEVSGYWFLPVRHLLMVALALLCVWAVLVAVTLATFSRDALLSRRP